MGFNTFFFLNLHLFLLIYKSGTRPTIPYGEGCQHQTGQTRTLDDFFQSVALGEVSRGSATLLQLWRMEVREGKRMKKTPVEKIAGGTISISDLFSCPNISFTVSLPDSIQTVGLLCLRSCFPSRDPHFGKTSRPYRRASYVWKSVQGPSSTSFLCVMHTAKQ